MPVSQPQRIPNFFQLAVGPHLTSYSYFAVVAVLALANNFWLATDLSNAPVVGRILAVLAAELLMVFIVGLAYLANRRAGNPLKPAAFFAIFLAAGAARGAFLEFLLQTLNFTDHQDYLFRIWVGATNFGLSGWVLAVLFGLAAEFTSQSRKLAAQRAYLSHLQTEVDDKVSAATEFEINAFREYLLANLKLKATEDAQRIRQQLQNTITDVIQPVVEQMLARRTAVQPGSQLLSESSLQATRVSISNVLRNISVVDSIRPLIQAMLPLLAAAVSAIVLFGLANALQVLFVMAVVWPILLWIVKRLFAPGLDRLPYLGRLVTIVAIFGLTISPAAYLASVYPTTGSGAFVPASIYLYAFTIGLVTAFWSAYEKEINRVYQARNSYLRQIRWKVAEVNSRSWHQQLHFARRVHGSLQSEVAAMAIRLDKMITQASSNPEEIEQLRGRLEERVRLVFEAPDKFTNLADVLTEIAETWEGICQVTVQLADGDAADIARDQIAVETVLEICREGISNAIRHGHAKNVTVAVSLEEVGLVNVCVANDGTPPVQPESSDGSAPGSAREGMGSKHLQECTVSYSVAVVGGQTVLEAAVPYRF